MTNFHAFIFYRSGGTIESVEAEANLDNKDFKKTLKITWLAESAKGQFTPTYCVYFDHIISKPVLAKDEDFKTYIPKNTRVSNVQSIVFLLGVNELQKWFTVLDKICGDVTNL